MIRGFISITVLVIMFSGMRIVMIMLLSWKCMVMFRIAVHHSRSSEALEGYRHKHDAQQKESEQLFHVLDYILNFFVCYSQQNEEQRHLLSLAIYLAIKAQVKSGYVHSLLPELA